MKDRQNSNLAILGELIIYFSNNPDIRFQQGLYNLGIISFNEDENHKYCLKDKYNEESTETYKKLENNIWKIKKQE